MATKAYIDGRRSAAYQYILDNAQHIRFKSREGATVYQLAEYVADQVCSGRKTKATAEVVDYCRVLIPAYVLG